MKKILPGLLVFIITINSQAQAGYDSITISRCTIENDWHGAKWADSLKGGRFKNYLKQEKTVWVKPAKTSNVLPAVISLSNRIRSNGTEDVSKCFIPRHSINFYKNGRIGRYLLVCFECDGVRFSDEPAKSFIKKIDTRDKQMVELKKLFKDIL
jgi:hypothetical protein